MGKEKPSRSKNQSKSVQDRRSEDEESLSSENSHPISSAASEENDFPAGSGVLANVKVKLERMPINLTDLMRKHNIKAIRTDQGDLIQRKSLESSPTKPIDNGQRSNRRGRNISEDDQQIMGKRRPKKVTSGSSSEDEDSVAAPRGETDDSDFEVEQEEGTKEDKGEAGNSTDSDIVPVKRKRIKVDYTDDVATPEKEESKGSGPGKKKRRVRVAKDSDSDSDQEAKHKRKNIRKVMSHKDLEADTKKAARDEMERRKRVEERQRLYNQMYNKEIEQVKELDSLVLDFDDETKTELLSVDKKLLKKLKPHQGAGVKFMFDACFESLKRMETEQGSGCILAHCMGLGKTLQVVTLVHTLLTASERTNVHRVLVICPLSTVLNWVNEFQMWLKQVEFNDDIDIYELSKFKQNNDRAKIIAQWHNSGGVLVMGYDLFRNLSNAKGARIKKKARDQLQMGLVDPGPDLVICDEGHLLKNEKTSLSKAVTKIRTLRRIVLTGTPLQNNLKEYYCMVQFVKPNLLGKYTEYLNRFVNPITNGQYNDSTTGDIEIMKRRSHVLHKLLDGCVQRRDYSVLAPFLPPKHEYVISIRLTEMQCKLYRHYMQYISQRSDPTQKHSSVLFQDYQNLQRIWTHPRVLRYNSDRYEINQQKKILDEEESDFIDDEDEEEEEEERARQGNSSTSDSESSLSLARVTRGRAATKPELYSVVAPEPQKVDNPTEWWMEMVPESELDNISISGKLLCLFAILAECEAIGDKLLVFSQSLFSLDVIEHFLSLADSRNHSGDSSNELLNGISGSWTLGSDYFRLDGSTAIDNRNLACKAFNNENNPKARLFLISTRAGGLGINLVAANRVVIFDASWNPSHDVQSIFRVYRFGQVKPCYIYRFLALGTMEEKIYERQVTKQAISKRVLDEQQIDRHYKENDLMELYTFDLEPEEERPVPELPKDRLFAELLQKYEHLIYKYHEHDSLLENKEGETLNEEERKAAWEEFEAEKSRVVVNYAQYTNSVGRQANGPVTSNNIFGFRTDILLRLLNLKARKENPAMTDQQINQVIPYLVQQLYRQMANNDLSLYNSLISIQQEFQAHPSMAQYGQFNPPGAYNPYAVNNEAFAVQQRLYQQQAIRQQQEAQQKMIQARLKAAEEAARATPSEVIELD